MKRLLLSISFIIMMAVFPRQIYAQQTVLKTDAVTADSLHKQGITLMSGGKLLEGRECTRMAMEMRKELFGELNEDYITSMNNYAISFSMEKNFAKAIELQRQVLQLCSKLPAPHKNIGMYTVNMGRFHYQNKEIGEAARYWEQAIPLVEKYGEEYEFLLENLGVIYIDLNDQIALEKIMALSDDFVKYKLRQPCNESGCMLERAEYFTAVEDNAKAKEHYVKILSMPMGDDMKVKVYDSYAKFLRGVDDYVAASEYNRMSADILHGKGDGEGYANRMYNAALNNYFAAQYQEAIWCYNETINFFGKYNSDAAGNNIAKCNKGIADCYSGLREFGKAAEYYSRLVDFYAVKDKDGVEYAKAVLRLAKAEKFNKEYESSIERHKQAMLLFEKLAMVEEYSDAANSLKLCYAYAGKELEVDMKEDELKKIRYAKLDKIIDETKANLSLNRRYFENHVYASSLATIAGCYALKEEYADAVDYYRQYMVEVRSSLKESFRIQSVQERMLMWEEVNNNLLQMQEMIVMLPVGYDELYNELSALIYDKALLSKGILLNSSIEFEKLLENYGNKSLKDAYAKSRANNEEISLLRQNALSQDALEKILALTRENNELQIMLYGKCKEFADFTDYISYSWKDVQMSLLEEDAAVEFNTIEFGPLNTDNFIVAAVLTKQMSHPMVIPVCNFQEADRMENSEQLFETDANLVWGALKTYLSGKKRVFFSADGHFNRIGIEYLKYDGKPLSEQFEVYRLSSTKELCYSKEAAGVKNVALFGDIDYNDDSGASHMAEVAASGLRSASGTNIFDKLESTLKEVDTIKWILESAKVKKVECFKGGNAASSVFFKLDDSKVNWLHIATHGAYRGSEGAGNEEAMDNSFLVFAGGNFDPEGIVTASEIAKMNLRHCDMVVLSACETGLGKLGNDGVFGLQRGFKNAGANTLLMSLNKVHDASTAELMINFYENLMAGFSKRESLVLAQKKLRESGYEHAIHWTSFILLDGFERK